MAELSSIARLGLPQVQYNPIVPNYGAPPVLPVDTTGASATLGQAGVLDAVSKTIAALPDTFNKAYKTGHDTYMQRQADYMTNLSDQSKMRGLQLQQDILGGNVSTDIAKRINGATVDSSGNLTLKVVDPETRAAELAALQNKNLPTTARTFNAVNAAATQILGQPGVNPNAATGQPAQPLPASSGSLVRPTAAPAAIPTPDPETDPDQASAHVPQSYPAPTVARAGSVFGRVPNGAGGDKQDPNDIADAGVAGFDPNHGKYTYQSPDGIVRNYNIKDPNLKGVALTPSDLRAAGIDPNDHAQVAAHVAEVRGPDGVVHQYPIVDSNGTPGRADFTLAAYRELGGPETRNGGLIPNLGVKVVPRGATAQQTASGGQETLVPDGRGGYNVVNAVETGGLRTSEPGGSVVAPADRQAISENIARGLAGLQSSDLSGILSAANEPGPVPSASPILDKIPIGNPRDLPKFKSDQEMQDFYAARDQAIPAPRPLGGIGRDPVSGMVTISPAPNVATDYYPGGEIDKRITPASALAASKRPQVFESVQAAKDYYKAQGGTVTKYVPTQDGIIVTEIHDRPKLTAETEKIVREANYQIQPGETADEVTYNATKKLKELSIVPPDARTAYDKFQSRLAQNPIIKNYYTTKHSIDVMNDALGGMDTKHVTPAAALGELDKYITTMKGGPATQGMTKLLDEAQPLSERWKRKWQEFTGGPKDNALLTAEMAKDIRDITQRIAHTSEKEVKAMVGPYVKSQGHSNIPEQAVRDVFDSVLAGEEIEGMEPQTVGGVTAAAPVTGGATGSTGLSPGATISPSTQQAAQETLAAYKAGKYDSSPSKKALAEQRLRDAKLIP